MVLIIVGAIALFIYMRFFFIEYTTVSFEPSDKLLQNPSRGFYQQFSTSNTRKMNTMHEKNITVVLLAYDLKDFTDREISAEKLAELDAAFTQVRECGLSAVFRAGYGFSSEYEKKDPSDIEIIKTHIKQIAPILAQHKEVLLTVQAGFIGPWGEWHSTNLADENGNIPTETINQVVEALCEAVPKTVSIGLRRPSFIRQLDAKKIDVGRIGLHNDALLSTATDMNTYDDKSRDRRTELDDLYARDVFVANGGEMPSISEYTRPENALEEFRKLRLTYLNHEYNREVLDDWRTSDYQGHNFFNVVQNRLGYRLCLNWLQLPKSFSQGRSIKIKLAIENVGFSGFVVPYSTELVIANEDGREVICLITDDYTVYRPGKEAVLSVTIPPNLAGDKLKLGIRIRNSDQALGKDTRYTVALATKKIDCRSGVNGFAKYALDQHGNYVLEE
ncbi:MAG: DUF4832 domain-containing protein [Angelakisella sp.]